MSIYAHVFNIVGWISFDLVNVLALRQMCWSGDVCFEGVGLRGIGGMGDLIVKQVFLLGVLITISWVYCC